MKILITGSSGFVGTHLTKLLSKNHQIIKFDLLLGQDVLDEKQIREKLVGVDLVIHLAAFISAIESWEKPKEYFENNALGTLSVVKNSIKLRVKKIIFFSSAAVKAKPFTPYAASKIATEDILHLYKDKINVVIVRPENIYGMGQKANYGYVIHNFINAVRSGKPIKIYGDGKQTRDLIYIDDVTNTVEKLLNLNIKSGTIVSLGTGKETRIIDLAKTVMEIMDKKVDIEFLEKRNEPKKSVANLSILSRLMVDFDEFTNLKAGIVKLLTYYKNN